MNVLDSVSKATLSGTAVIARMVGRIVIYRLDGDSESVSRSKTASPVISSTRAQYIVISRGKSPSSRSPHGFALGGTSI